MKVVVINASYRPEGTTTQLARKALEGAASIGAETAMIVLKDHRIDYCTNCLRCYNTGGDGVAACSIEDDMTRILESIRDADGIIFASPVHNGFVSGLMTVFFERTSWRVLRPEGRFLGSMGMVSRLTDKVRAVASIMSAGGMSEKNRKYCDDGTPWLKSNAPLLLHAEWIGDMYAGAVLERLPESEKDWEKLYFLRKLSGRQLEQAYALGVTMAGKIRDGNLAPVTLDDYAGSATRALVSVIQRFSPPYKTLEQE